MKTKSLLTIFVLACAILSKAATVTIANVGLTFSPANITISAGDTINFSISGSHNAREVSQATWNTNGSAALSGGFQTAFGGGIVLPTQLSVGTHYYVCSPHAGAGMKGVIIVQNTNSISETDLSNKISIYPNPNKGLLTLNIANLPLTNGYTANIINLEGKVLVSTFITGINNTIDIANLPKGLYYLKLQNEKFSITKKVILE